ncbi:hypothetical protein B0T26DRAFT_674822 [Lasiosphaeria miniovina]|uniref:G-patch domain-containing protein n=1 Tax=Lasiosphaeria miniovina TaxID=1954250 RepID=A0AA40AWE4_9PEZI|nr:uncharacterized protein B0T26DRAFT_674822 [Lasiosphaeria miniovina]KAK0723224.1 hypothetical protein B0T26DRAFT_674822 [Lasiosphaeria miniovina]
MAYEAQSSTSKFIDGYTFWLPINSWAWVFHSSRHLVSGGLPSTTSPTLQSMRFLSVSSATSLSGHRIQPPAPATKPPPGRLPLSPVNVHPGTSRCTDTLASCRKSKLAVGRSLLREYGFKGGTGTGPGPGSPIITGTPNNYGMYVNFDAKPPRPSHQHQAGQTRTQATMFQATVVQTHTKVSPSSLS